MSSKNLVIEAFIGEGVFITGVYGQVNTEELKAIEKELEDTYSTSDDWDNWFKIRANVEYENGGRHDPSYWLIEEVGRKPCNPSANNDLASYLMSFDGIQPS